MDINSAELRSIIKDVLKDDGLLDQSLKSHIYGSGNEPSTSNTKATDTTSHIVDGEALLNDETFITKLVEKVSEALVANPKFHELLELTINKHNKVVLEKKAQLEEAIERHEQYSRRNCLIIHGLPAKKNENTDEEVEDCLWHMMGVEINDADLDRTHRLPSKIKSYKSAVNAPLPPIIVKFISHNLKSFVYFLKKKLRGLNYLITESLTRTRVECVKKLEELRKKKKISSYWTIDGTIYYTKFDSSTKFKVNNMHNLEKDDI